MTRSGTIRGFLARIGAPMPWRIGLAWSRGEAVHTLLDADGRKIDLRVWDTEADARRLCAVNAIAPAALAYVEDAACRGGQEAKAILAEYERMASGPVGWS